MDSLGQAKLAIRTLQSCILQLKLVKKALGPKGAELIGGLDDAISDIADSWVERHYDGPIHENDDGLWPDEEQLRQFVRAHFDDVLSTEVLDDMFKMLTFDSDEWPNGVLVEGCP